jgi:hypothetical protein
MSQVTNKRGPVGSHRNGATEWQGEPCRNVPEATQSEAEPTAGRGAGNGVDAGYPAGGAGLMQGEPDDAAGRVGAVAFQRNGGAVAPAWQASRSEAPEALRSGARGGTSPRQQRFLRTIVAVEVGLSLVLLTGRGAGAAWFRAACRTGPWFRSGAVAGIPR